MHTTSCMKQGVTPHVDLCFPCSAAALSSGVPSKGPVAHGCQLLLFSPSRGVKAKCVGCPLDSHSSGRREQPAATVSNQPIYCYKLFSHTYIFLYTIQEGWDGPKVPFVLIPLISNLESEVLKNENQSFKAELPSKLLPAASAAPQLHHSTGAGLLLFLPGSPP